MYRDIRALSNGCLDLLGPSGVGLLRYESFLLLLRQSKMYSTQRHCLRRSRAHEETEHWHRNGFVNDTRLTRLRTRVRSVRCGQASHPEGPSLLHHVLVFSSSALQRVPYPPISAGRYNLSPVIDSAL
jgi:hypothetical protein